jgi:hypothetical protein
VKHQKTRNNLQSNKTSGIVHHGYVQRTGRRERREVEYVLVNDVDIGARDGEDLVVTVWQGRRRKTARFTGEGVPGSGHARGGTVRRAWVQAEPRARSEKERGRRRTREARLEEHLAKTLVAGGVGGRARRSTRRRRPADGGAASSRGRGEEGSPSDGKWEREPEAALASVWFASGGARARARERGEVEGPDCKKEKKKRGRLKNCQRRCNIPTFQ